jgi:cytochrome bd-type quinol oxidase subunit 2
MFFELTWAGMCPPLLAVFAVVLANAWLENTATENSQVTTATLLVPLMFAGMTILTSAIYFDCRAIEAFRSRAARVRTTQGISAAITLIFLSVAKTAQAEQGQVPDTAALVLFLCLPVLFLCAGLLWHAATIIKSSFRRGLMLTGFVALTAFVEWQSTSVDVRNAEERLFMMNSLLVAAAFAIQLSVWSTRALGRR